MAILTYHRILDEQHDRGEGHCDRQFYDLPAQRFRQQVEKVAAQARAYEKGASLPHVELTFDDGTRDHLFVAGLLAKLDLSGIFFIITARLGTAGYLTRSDIRTLLDLGQRIGSHTVTHRRICDLTDSELRFELEQSRDVLRQQAGREIEWFAPPGGFLDKRCIEAALRYGYRFVRTMRWGYATITQTGEISCVPVLPRIGEKRFDRIISGKASFNGFRLKEAAKRLVGEQVYIALRNRLGKRR